MRAEIFSMQREPWRRLGLKPGRLFGNLYARYHAGLFRGRCVQYSLTYSMLTGRGVRISASAGDALLDHAALLLAGASGIVIRNAKSLVVTLAEVTAIAKWDADRT